MLLFELFYSSLQSSLSSLNTNINIIFVMVNVKKKSYAAYSIFGFYMIQNIYKNTKTMILWLITKTKDILYKY